jgi:hypothetical protein
MLDYPNLINSRDFRASLVVSEKYVVDVRPGSDEASFPNRVKRVTVGPLAYQR